MLTGVFIEGLHESTPHSIRTYWRSKKNAMVHDLAHHMTLHANLKHGLTMSDTPRILDMLISRQDYRNPCKGSRNRQSNKMMAGSTTTPSSPGSPLPEYAPVMAIQNASPSSPASTVSSAALSSAENAHLLFLPENCPRCLLMTAPTGSNSHNINGSSEH